MAYRTPVYSIYIRWLISRLILEFLEILMTRSPRSFAPALVAPALGLALLITPVATFPTLAAGGGDSTTVTTPKCKKGFAWDRRAKKCKAAKKSSNLSDEDLFQTARELAFERRYDEALTMLDLAADQSAPRILNYRGFATRKLGRVEEALTYYQAALAIDPNYTLVREYMGEAYLQLGQIDKARAQLKEIAMRCGTECREYALLEAEIEKAVQ
ncbi:MAG: tetratricopeptide repeat protein [Pseudomonadota bacterium]